MNIVVRSPEELVAAVPQVLGFQPAESLVLVPFTPDVPAVRVDMPRTAADRDEGWAAVREPFLRYATPAAQVGLVCFTTDQDCAELAVRYFAERFDSIGVATPVTMWTDGNRWADLGSGEGGDLTPAVVDQMAAAAVLEGHAQPSASRDAIAAAMVGDRAPIRGLLPEARAVATISTVEVEREWALGALSQFHRDGDRLPDVAAARLLVALETVETRDALWNDMTRENSTTHVALWHDLTRRAPDEVRAAPASMLGFASWLKGDGAQAWCALDQVPRRARYAMAGILAVTLEHGVHPREWDQHRPLMQALASDLDEVLVPRPADHARDDPPATSRDVERPGPAR